MGVGGVAEAGDLMEVDLTYIQVRGSSKILGRILRSVGLEAGILRC
jgi:hypothetical protein